MSSSSCRIIHVDARLSANPMCSRSSVIASLPILHNRPRAAHRNAHLAAIALASRLQVLPTDMHEHGCEAGGVEVHARNVVHHKLLADDIRPDRGHRTHKEPQKPQRVYGRDGPGHPICSSPLQQTCSCPPGWSRLACLYLSTKDISVACPRRPCASEGDFILHLHFPKMLHIGLACGSYKDRDKPAIVDIIPCFPALSSRTLSTCSHSCM